MSVRLSGLLLFGAFICIFALSKLAEANDLPEIPASYLRTPGWKTVEVSYTEFQGERSPSQKKTTWWNEHLRATQSSSEDKVSLVMFTRPGEVREILINHETKLYHEFPPERAFANAKKGFEKFAIQRQNGDIVIPRPLLSSLGGGSSVIEGFGLCNAYRVTVVGSSNTTILISSLQFFFDEDHRYADKFPQAYAERLGLGAFPDLTQLMERVKAEAKGWLVETRTAVPQEQASAVVVSTTKSVERLERLPEEIFTIPQNYTIAERPSARDLLRRLRQRSGQENLHTDGE